MFFVRFVTFYRHLSILCYGLAIMVRQVSPTTTKFAAPLPKLSLLTIFKKLIFMKKKKLLLIALSLMAGSAYMKADIVDLGSESLTEWSAAADDVSFFDLSGRRANDKSGIRIVNGRKFYFKK
jgi:hypothetical protein